MTENLTVAVYTEWVNVAAFYIYLKRVDQEFNRGSAISDWDEAVAQIQEQMQGEGLAIITHGEIALVAYYYAIHRNAWGTAPGTAQDNWLDAQTNLLYGGPHAFQIVLAAAKQGV